MLHRRRALEQRTQVTRKEFIGGWKTLKGAGLQGGKESSEDVYFSALESIPAKDWGDLVRRAIIECTFFPPVGSLLELHYSIQRESRALPPPRSRELPAPVVGDPACPAKPGEQLFEYLERLAFFLGYLPVGGAPVREMPPIEFP